jgi:hypothetical protein
MGRVSMFLLANAPAGSDQARALRFGSRAYTPGAGTAADTAGTAVGVPKTTREPREAGADSAAD